VAAVSDAVNDFNNGIIAEFRANAGKVGGMFEGANLLLLHTRGAKSGAARVTPLGYRPVGDGWAIFGSFAGRPMHPAWYHNLVADPDVEIEVGTDAVPVRARTTTGAERDEIWTAQKGVVPQLAEYERTAEREIPVVVLTRR
jgi:deazaflavin-dependent oxidoreductase (nitroreductase family)